MTKKKAAEAREAMRLKIAALDKEYKDLMASNAYESQDGWNSPPAQLPRAGEIAMGIFYDPYRNTH
ncbi:MAG TPA: hypothetical protein VGP73_29285 [Thermoanaerobaculia bacterium]